MMIELQEEHLTYQEQFRIFTDQKIVPYAAQNDLEQRLNPDVVKHLAEAGYLGSMLPTSYGGMGLDSISIGFLNEEIGRGCTSARNLLTVHGMVALAILRWGSPEQREKWLPALASGDKIGAFGLTEEKVGSDAKSVQSTVVADGDHYVLNGVKKWITMGHIADVFVIFARLEDKPTAFLVERSTHGFSTELITGMLGSRGSMLAVVKMEECRIPKANLLGREGMGLTQVALSCLDYGRYTVACGCIGLAQACLEASVQYAKEREQFGTPLSEFQLIQKMITEMAVTIKAGRLLCQKAGSLKDAGDPDSIMETWTAKYFASIMVNKVASDAVQIHGANGCHTDYPVERYFRDARINEIIEGTTQIHEHLIARNVFRSM